MGETDPKAKSGLDIAIDQTLKIASRLHKYNDKNFYRKLVYDIFNDQLKLHTKYNREQRHAARARLKVALENQEAE